MLDWALLYDEFSIVKKLEIAKTFNPYSQNERQPHWFKKIYSSFDAPPDVCADQKLIRELSNNFKHFKQEKHPTTQRENYLSTAGNMYAGGPNAYAGYFEEYGFYVDSNEGRQIDLLALFDRLIQKWENLIIPDE